MKTSDPIGQYRNRIAKLCREFRVRRLDAFGSVVRDDFDAERSDIDFLVEFEPDLARNRFHDYFDLKEALTELVGRPVDLVMAGAVQNRYIRDAIESDRRPVYAA